MPGPGLPLRYRGESWGSRCHYWCFVTTLWINPQVAGPPSFRSGSAYFLAGEGGIYLTTFFLRQCF